MDNISVFAELHAFSYDKFRPSGGLLGNQEISITSSGTSYWLVGISIPLVL